MKPTTKRNPAASPAPSQDAGQDALENLLAQVGEAGARIRVLVIDPSTGKQAMRCEYDGASFDLWEMAQDVGGGSYIIQTIDPTTKRVTGSCRHDVDRAIQPRRPIVRPPTIQAAPPPLQFVGQSIEQAAPAAAAPNLPYEMRLEMERMKWKIEQMEAERNRPAAPQSSIFGELTAILPVLKELIPARSPLTESIAGIKSIKEMLREELAGSGGESGNGIPWGSLIASVAEALKQAKQQHQPVAALPPAASSPALQPAATSSPTSPAAPTVDPKIQRVIGIIELFASTDGSAESASEYAPVLWDALVHAAGEDGVSALLSGTNEQVTTALIQNVPSLAGREPFIHRLADAMRSLHTADDDAPPASIPIGAGATSPNGAPPK